jgi:hypothetical protein
VGRRTDAPFEELFVKVSGLTLMVGDGRLQTETLLDGLDVVCRQNGNVAAATVALARGTVLAIANQIQTPDEAASDAGLFRESREQLLHRVWTITCPRCRVRVVESNPVARYNVALGRMARRRLCDGVGPILRIIPTPAVIALQIPPLHDMRMSLFDLDQRLGPKFRHGVRTKSYVKIHAGQHLAEVDERGWVVGLLAVHVDPVDRGEGGAKDFTILFQLGPGKGIVVVIVDLLDGCEIMDPRRGAAETRVKLCHFRAEPLQFRDVSGPVGSGDILSISDYDRVVIIEDNIAN